MFEFEFTSELVKWQGKAAWHFILLPEDLSEDINKWASGLKAGWGSLPVQARIGTTSFETSIFPSKSNGTYLLPVKATVRKAESLDAGDEVVVVLRI